MNTINNLTSSLTSNQLPSFIANEYPLFIEFIQTYYQGLEKSGESLDLVNNLLNYLDVDFYQNKISTSCILLPPNGKQEITATDTTITVNSTSGFPDVDGLIQIDSEIILYKSKTDTQFLSCSRGVSGVTNIDGGFQYSYSVSSKHSKNAIVTNLSYLFILYFFSKIKKEYLPYFNQNFAFGLNISTFIKNIKQFYNVKGTSKSFDFLIRAFFNESNETLYPRERMIKPSDAIFDKKTIIKCKAISGNPLNLVGQKLVQEQPNGYSSFVYVDSIQERFTSAEPIYELVIDSSALSNNIIVPPKTKLINSVFSSDTSIIVDSTIGFWKSGYIKIGNEIIQYTDKTLNQFLNCTRGTNPASYEVSTEVTDTSTFYGESNVDGSKIYLNILGISNSAIITDSSQNYFSNDIVYVDKVGYSDNSILTKNWVFNVPKLLKIISITNDSYDVVVTTQYEHNLRIGNQINIYGFDNPIFNGLFLVTSVNSTTQFTYKLSTLPSTSPNGNGYVSIAYKFGNNNIPADIINIYDENNTNLYVASSGVPSHSIGAGISLGNQRYLKRIPRKPLTTGTATTISPGDVGIFINGVLAQSCISSGTTTYGEITSISIDNPGLDYGVGISGGPTLTISNGTGTTATATCIVNGGLKKIYVIDGGSGYYTKPVVQIVGAGGSGALAEAIVNNGKVTSIIVLNSGTGYTSIPTINLIGGNGNGAIFAPIVSGPIAQVNITNPGSGYTSVPNISINLGNGAVAAPIISNGIIQSIALISGGTGYNSIPDVFVNDSTGNGVGAQILANVSNGSITSFTVISGGINYSEGYTTISVVPSGKNAILTPKVRKWTYNLFNNSSLDQNNGYVSYGKNSQFGNQYSYLATPKGLRYQVSDNLSSNLTESITPTTHSPIIGWAYDGNPIYGPYGYNDPNDVGSGVVRIGTGYSAISTRLNGPSTSLYPIGKFIEDYVYVPGISTLDENNGRWCITPEFPKGTYAYFTTINSNGTPAFPYILGKNYYSIPDSWNLQNISTQDNLPSSVLRYRDPYQNLDADYTRKIANSSPFIFVQEDGVSPITQEDSVSNIQSEQSIQLYDYFPRITDAPKLSVKTSEQGSISSIDSFYIENKGSGYKVGDRLVFDNTNTGGYGASAKVSYISGSGITSVSSKAYTKINYSNLNGGFVAPTNIVGLSSGTGATVSYVDLVNSNLYVSSSGNFALGELISTNYNSVFNTGITTGTGTSIDSGYISTSLSASIGVIDTNITTSSGTGISIGTNLLIGNEILKVFSGSGNSFSVYRGQFGTGSSSYNSGTVVSILPSIQVNNSSLFDIGNYVKIDNEVFRIVDLNNSTNTIILLRSQIGSSLSSHSSGTTLYKVNVSNAKINKISTTYTITLGTGVSSNLNQFDTIKVSSGSTLDTSYVGTFNVLSTNSSSLTYETKTLGTGNSGTLSYTTNSQNAIGPIAEIQLNSGGAFYKVLPKVSVSSVNGTDAIIIPQSSNTGKIRELTIDDFGYNLNPDFTLKPDLSFTQIVKLNKTSVIDSINVGSGGSGYQYIPNVSITGGGGQGATAIASINNGRVVGITVTNPGYGYSSIPTITANKTFPCYINTFNSTFNFSVPINNSIKSGDLVKIYTDGNYPIIYGGLSTSPTLSFYAIVGGGLDSNQIQLSLSYSNSLAGNYIKFITTGTGNLSLVIQSGNAILNPIIKTKDFIAGETVYQYDNSGNVIASGVVSSNYGWQSSSKTLRLDNVSGTFILNSFRIIGSKSKSTGYPYQIKTASGKLLVNSSANTNGEFITETGNLSNREQHVIDSDYYQNYSYVLKNNIDYKNWASSLKNIAHPSGFKVYGNRTISSGTSHISSGQSSSFVSLQQNLHEDLSLSTFNNFAIAQPDYSTSLKDQVTIYNRLLTSSEQIKTSKVDRIDDISNLVSTYVGNGTTTQFSLNDKIKNIVTKTDISVTINDLLQPIESYTLNYNLDNNYNITAAKVIFNTPPANNSNIQITCGGLNFDGVNKNFPIYFNGQLKSFNNSQILITLNGIVQTYESYDISKKSLIKFNEIPSANSSINIFRVGSGASFATQIVSTGASSYTISSGASNDTSLVVIDGILQNSDAYNIFGTNITFSENVSSGSTIYIRSYGSGMSSRQLIGVGSTTNIVPISVNISTGSTNAIVSLNGIVQNPSSYTIGSGSTCIIFSEEVSTGSSIYILNFDKNVDFYQSPKSDGASTDFLLDEKLTKNDDYIVIIDGIVQIPGINNSFDIPQEIITNINFVEPPKPRTKFFGLLYNRLNPSGNAIIDDFSKTYISYNNSVGNFVVNDSLYFEPTGSSARITKVDSDNKIITLSNLNGTFSAGQTLVSGIASGSTGVQTTLKYGGLVPSILQRYQDSSNIIRTNKQFIQEEAYGYITNKYPSLLTNSGLGAGISDITKCKRDIGYFIDAITSDLEVGGNSTVIDYASFYYKNYSPAYINNQIPQSQETFRYARDLAISAMRNWTVNIPNCSFSSGSTIIGVGTTIGLVLNMSVTGFGISTGSSIVGIGSTNIFINKNTTSIGTGLTLNFTLNSGKYSTITPVTQSVTIDTNNPSCSNVASSIASLTDLYNNILSSGYSVMSIQVGNAGSGYTNTSIPTITIQSPGGTGTTATATAVVSNSGTIQQVNVTNVGSGYTFSPSILISAPIGAGTTAILIPSIGFNVTTNAGLISRNLIGNGTTITLTNGTGITAGDYLIIGGETLKVISKNDSYGFNVSRAGLGTTQSYHPSGSSVIKYTPSQLSVNTFYTGFTGSGSTFTLTTGGNPYNYNGTSFSLPSSQLDTYGQDYSQSLLAILNGIIQDNNASGAFTLSGSSINFTEAPKEGFGFYGRYFGKLRRLNDISSKFNGIRLSFNLNIGNNLIYSIIPPNSSIDISNNVLIFINGVLQNPGEAFSIIGSRIIFSEPPRPGTSFLGYVYIGSDDDVVAYDILQPVEVGDQVFIDGEQYDRDVFNIDSSSSISTLGYTGSIDGTNAVATASISSGRLASITVNNGGSGYYQPPIVLFTGGGGYGAQAYATVNNGTITGITITSRGANYTSAPNIIFTRNLTLSKTQRVRTEYNSVYKKVTTLGTGLTFGSGTSLPATNQTISIGSANSFNTPGSILIIDDSRPYRVSELITYTNISGNTLTGCVRGVGFNFNKVFQLDNTTYNFGLGQTITNGTGATGNVISWDSSNSLLFVNRTSNIDFSTGDTIIGVGAGISDAAFIQKYLSYGSGTTIIQVS